jgi:hypothetical protein
MSWKFYGKIPINSSSSSYWTPPFKSDALFGLDGTIITVGADKYFKDKLGTRNFLITGYDFDSTWTKGFPYKSAATISAPIGDAVLIAADLNNYLYDSGGTPNEIPVVSLFQDVDYEHRLFSKHIAQVLDVNYVETSEPYVSEIVMYATEKATTELTTCQTYYGVPIEDANAKWINEVTGSDAAVGTKATPVKTMVGAIAKGWTNNTKVYIKTGNEIFSGYLGLWPVTYDWSCIGKIGITSDGATFVIRTDHVNNKLRGFIVTGTSQQLPLSTEGADGTDFLVDKCYVKGFNSSGVCCIRAGFGNAVIQNSIFTGTPGSIVSGAPTSKTINILGCKNNSNVIFLSPSGGATNTYNVKYCKLNNSVIANVRFSNNYNLFNNVIIGVLNSFTDGAFIGIFEAQRNSITSKADGVISGFAPSGAVTANYTWNIQFNVFTTSMFKNQIFNAIDQAVVTFSNNILNALGSSQGISGVFADGRAARACVATIENNYMVGDNATQNGYTLGAIEVGNQAVGTGDNMMEGSIVSKNTINNLTASSSSHGIAVFKTKNVTVSYNKEINSGIGIVYKSWSATSSGSKCFGNILVNTGGILLKGYSGLTIAGNTVINTIAVDSGNSCVQLIDNPTPNPDEASIDNVIKNNIFIYTDSSTDFCLVVDNGTNTIFDYNIYYSILAKPFKKAGTAYTFAEWQALGYDAHSIFLTLAQFNALFNDFANGDYSLKAGSAAIGTGEALDAAYDDGLDASTNWGSVTTLPVVVTKQQGAAWDIGAYIH